VIGGTGFVVTRVLRLLSEEGHEVPIFHRGPTEGVGPQGVKVAFVVPDW
jgi:uncharacterized protein YbjT (DUF2867 family)